MNRKTESFSIERIDGRGTDVKVSFLVRRGHLKLWGFGEMNKNGQEYCLESAPDQQSFRAVSRWLDNTDAAILAHKLRQGHGA